MHKVRIVMTIHEEGKDEPHEEVDESFDIPEDWDVVNDVQLENTPYTPGYINEAIMVHNLTMIFHQIQRRLGMIG